MAFFRSAYAVAYMPIPVAKRVGAIDRYMQLGNKMLEKGMDIYRDPTLAAVLATEGVDIAKEVGLALSLADDPETVLKGRLGVSKRVAWAEPLALEEVMSVSRALRCTVNDILLASATGALRSYMIERGDCVEGLTLRATVPVNLRPLEHARKLGNHFGLVFLDLPVGEGNPIRRLERVAESMGALLREVDSDALIAALKGLPEDQRDVFFRAMSARAADGVRDEKVKVLRSLRPLTAGEVESHSVRGQYGAGAILGQPVSPYEHRAAVVRVKTTSMPLTLH